MKFSFLFVYVWFLTATSSEKCKQCGESVFLPPNAEYCSPKCQKIDRERSTGECSQKRKRIQEEKQDCSLCLEDILAKQNVTTPCKHQFHVKCIKPWIQKNKTCPLCRFKQLKMEGNKVLQISQDEVEQIQRLQCVRLAVSQHEICVDQVQRRLRAVRLALFRALLHTHVLPEDIVRRYETQAYLLATEEIRRSNCILLSPQVMQELIALAVVENIEKQANQTNILEL